ncbi:MAG: TadE/TadG family type IV pilus assembly protein, partial [Phycisphaerae bacterium]
MEWDCVHKLEIRNVEDHRMAVCLCGRLMRWRTTSKASRAAARARWGAMLLARSRLGAVALEFALVFPVFLLLIYGLFEFSRVFWTENTLEFA